MVSCAVDVNNPDQSPLRLRAIALSRGLRRVETLPALMSDYHICLGAPLKGAITDRVIAWGMRPSSFRAKVYAANRKLDLLYVEDGLLRSINLGPTDPPFSLMVDELGLYLDASLDTRLEHAIRAPVNDSEFARAADLIDAWRTGRVSKYNHYRETPLDCLEKFVLVVDQTAGDASIALGLANASSFDAMLSAALLENPEMTIVVKVHPEVAAGRKLGHFDLGRLRATARVRVVSDGVHPVALLSQAEIVYVVTSQLGFEALMWGKKVRTFGMPFYGGWGLTDDLLASPLRRTAVDIHQLVYGVLVRYMRCVDPETNERCSPEILISWMSFQRSQRERFPSRIQGFAFSKWKQPFVRDFFNGSKVEFVRRAKDLSLGEPIALWGLKHDSLLVKQIGLLPPDVTRVEDGFLRSVGLGADLIRPISWVQDSVGIYYDASRPSGLEVLLSTAVYSKELLERAVKLRLDIVAAHVTKYNLSNDFAWSRPSGKCRVILVPGQVESDASIIFGGLDIRTNLGLLKAVRSSNSDAIVIYKPHPDVIEKLRDSGTDELGMERWCDQVIGNVPMDLLLEQVDEVHTLTSLTGFEALLRGKRVVTYGQPFYAGWGLTRDTALSEAVQIRRRRRLHLDQLVAGTLILYPTYVSRTTQQFTTPERALEELISWRAETIRFAAVRRWIARLSRKI